MSIEPAHLPNFIRDAVGALHRYVNSGEAIAKAELHRLMVDLHILVGKMPAEEGEVQTEVMSFEARVADGVRKALPEVENFVHEAKKKVAALEAEVADLKAQLAAAEKDKHDIALGAEPATPVIEEPWPPQTVITA